MAFVYFIAIGAGSWPIFIQTCCGQENVFLSNNQHFQCHRLLICAHLGIDALSNEAEEIVEAELEQAAVDVVQTEDSVVTPPALAQVYKTYWLAADWR